MANQPSRIGRRVRTTGLQSGIFHRPYGLERPPSPLKAESVWCDLEPDFSSKDPKLPSFSCQNSRCCIALSAALCIPPLGGTICSCTQSASPAPIRIDPKVSLAVLQPFHNVANSATTAHRRHSPPPTAVVVGRPAERDHRSVIPQSSRPALQTFPASHSAGPHDQSRCLSTRRRASNPSAKRMFH